ncbi:MAG: DUF4387 domain-containing protein [Planctomycetota bacterium]|jgi:hypothetical protein
MMRLYDHADVIRSKNAGPFTLTIDLIFKDEKQFSTILNSPSFNEKAIALLYNVPEQAVKIHSLKQVYAIKVTLPRVFGSCGGPGDRDVYGCQQHFPLADMEIQL